MRPFKFQWQKVKGEYLGPEIFSISPQQQSGIGTQRPNNKVIFAILGSLVSTHR